MVWSKIPRGGKGRKNTAPVNRVGVVSPVVKFL
jgi:hypothetical protein